MNGGREHMSKCAHVGVGGASLCFGLDVLDEYRAPLRCPAGGGM